MFNAIENINLMKTHLTVNEDEKKIVNLLPPTLQNEIT
jgi:hypothetical protein